jgi:hypothetical protein
MLLMSLKFWLAKNLRLIALARWVPAVPFRLLLCPALVKWLKMKGRLWMLAYNTHRVRPYRPGSITAFNS